MVGRQGMKYLKAIMAAGGGILTALAVYYGHDQWYPVLTTAWTAAAVYLVPNKPGGQP